MNSDGNFKKLYTWVSQAALDVFYPKKCIFCNSFVNIGKSISVCSSCVNKFDDHGKNVRDDRKYFEEAVCALRYESHIKDAMTDFKFKNIGYLDKTFAYAIYNKIKTRRFLDSVSIICAVPIHPFRDRDYNQSQRIAAHLSQYTHISQCDDLLIKIRNLNPLSKMGYSMRRHLIKSSITFNAQYNIEGKNICLIDDIYTTGSTSNECARILKMHGADKIYVLSACYADDKTNGGNKNADTDIIT